MSFFIRNKYFLLVCIWLYSPCMMAQTQTIKALQDRTKEQQQTLQNQTKAIIDQQKMIYDMRDKLARQETAIKVLESQLTSKEQALQDQIKWNINVIRIIAGFIIFGVAVVIWQRNFLGRNLLGVWIEDNFKESIRYYLKDMIQRKVRDRDVREIVREKGKDAVEAVVNKHIKEVDLADVIATNARPEIEKALKDLEQEVADKLKGKVPAWEQDFTRYLALGHKLEAKTSILNETLAFPAEVKLELQEFKKVLFKVKNPPDFTPEDWYLKGIDEYETNALKEARESFTQVLYQNPEDTNAILFRGAIHKDLAEYRSALKVLNQVLQGNPEHNIAKVLRAETHFKMKKYDKAIEDYDQILAATPEYSFGFYGRGNAYKEKFEYTAAIENYQIAVEKDQTFTPAYLSVIELQIINGNYEGGQQYLDQLNDLPELRIRDQIMAKYFLILLRNLQNLGTAEAELQFDELLQQDIEVSWDLSKVDKWLSTNSELDKDTTLFINQKNKLLKQKMGKGEIVEA
ncbi:hypothetical protein BKI52_25665 [marine bacterium AO1-C]|nr:hypothetical protein BKI52_25665 [marine bacterium AO1-C]